MFIPKGVDLFDASHSIVGKDICAFAMPWEALKHISAFVEKIGPTLSDKDYIKLDEHIYIAKSAKVAPTAFIGDHTIIGENTEVRHGAFIRSCAIVGKDAVVGNSTEIKNAILFDAVQVPHYNYVGDSILGYRAHMGAGSIASNFRSDKGNISITFDGKKQETGLRKLGALLGDFVEIGCNSVLCPGSIVGRDSMVYPLSRVRGVIPEKHIFKGSGLPVPKK